VVRVIKAVYDEYGFEWDPEGYHADLYDLDGYYTRRGDRFYVALQDGVVQGTGALELFPAHPAEFANPLPRIEGCDCSIERVYVHPEARRQGIGLAITQRVIQDARDLGRSKMESWSDKRFTEAHLLYQKMGAEVVAERICDDPEESPEWGLALRL
jgi:putative acetyltransferase